MSFDINQFAQSLGWSLAGASSPVVDDQTKERYLKWLSESKGEQMNYLERRKNERLEPKEYFSEVESILCFAAYYYPGEATGSVKVSNYSWGEDYHTRLSNLLELTASKLKEIFAGFQYRKTVDTSPVLEKYFAVRAGLGWQGKNTLLIHRGLGSYLFLGELFTNIPLERFQISEASVDHCGNCRRCIEACPTDALSPYTLRADRCISYWTLEHKGEFNEQTPDFDSWVAGCDICQEVCPWNAKLSPLREGYDPSLQNLHEKDILDPKWQERIQDKAVSYVRPHNWSRNLEHIKKSTKSD